MITLENNNIHYDYRHLTSLKPRNYAEVLARLKGITCNLFYNIISSPDCRYERNYAEGRIKDSYKDMNAEERFKNIFTEQVLHANPKSFFVNKLNVPPKECNAIKSVSFALADHEQLAEHFKARGSEFGICFFHEFLQNRGLRKVEYLNDNDIEAKRSYVFNAPHLLEVYSEKYDMRWENEWRIHDSLPFIEDDIAFVIVPQDRYNYFVDWFMESGDFQNVQIIAASAFNAPADHLIFFPQQDNNSWRQVRIFNSPISGQGFKIDPDVYNDIPSEKKKEFENQCWAELACFTKNTILSNYEYAYINKYQGFRARIANTNGMGELFSEFDHIEENNTEPHDAQRDLVTGLFESLFQIADIPLY